MTLDRLFAPRSVGIVGASAEPTKITGMIVNFLRRSGFSGRIYPVNPRYEQLLEWRCFPSVEALPESPDIVVICVPVAVAFEALEQSAARGVPFVVLMTGGFGEGTSGHEGERRRDRLIRLCRETGVRVLGPNTVGMVNFRGCLPLTFADWYGRDTGQRGGVAILTHSGSVGGLIFSSLQLNRVGVDYWIATGNEANLEIADFIDHLGSDDGIDIIVCFMEGVVQGRRFMSAAEKARDAGKTIVVLKSGDSEESLRSTEAHTIKRSTGPDVYRDLFRQLGIIQVGSLQELAYAVKLLSMIGDKFHGSIGILSASGGACSLISDHVIRAGLGLPELDAATQRRLAKTIPVYGSTLNPVDLSADVVSRREIIDGAFATLGSESSVDTWLVFGRPIIDRYYPEICTLAAGTNKAVIVSGGVPLYPEVEDALQKGGVPVLQDPEICMRALGAIHRGRRSGAGTRDWLAWRCRPVGNTAVDDGWVQVLVDRIGIKEAKSRRAGGARAAAVAGTQRVLLAIRQDPDFGPVLTLQHGAESTKRDMRRVVRALPVTNIEVADAVTEICATATYELAHAAAQLRQIADRLCSAYASEQWLAEAILALALGPDGLELESAAIAPAGSTMP